MAIANFEGKKKHPPGKARSAGLLAGASLIYTNPTIKGRCKVYHGKSKNGNGSRDIYLQKALAGLYGGGFGGCLHGESEDELDS